MRRFAPIVFGALAGCTETDAPHPFEPVSIPRLAAAPVVTTAPFYATAECGGDIGNIRFGGERVLMSHTTTDNKGRTHTSQHFRVQDFRGWHAATGSPPSAAADFDVQGGAEMFVIHRDAGGNIVIRIHQGNLVFRDIESGEVIVAHHTIRTLPGKEMVSYWSCRSSA